MEINGVSAYVIKMTISSAKTFVSFNVRLMDPNALFESEEPIYCCLQLLDSTKYITLQELESTYLKQSISYQLLHK